MDDQQEYDMVMKYRSDLEEGAAKLGLYLQDFGAFKMVEPTQGGDTITHDKFVKATFLVGDIAWSDKVQDPSGYAKRTMLKDALSDLEVDQSIDAARELRELMNG